MILYIKKLTVNISYPENILIKLLNFDDGFFTIFVW